jgi:hypothetical protein
MKPGLPSRKETAMADDRGSERAGISRREALRRVGQVLLAPAALLLGRIAEAAPGLPPKGVTVFRLRPCPPSVGVRRCSCNACVQHAQNKFFATQAAADSHRAHKHCNCVIVSEVITPLQFQLMFRPGTRLARQVFDRRW